MPSKLSSECGPNDMAEKLGLKINTFEMEVRCAKIRLNTLTHQAITFGESMLYIRVILRKPQVKIGNSGDKYLWCANSSLPDFHLSVWEN